MMKSAKTKVDDLLAKEFHLLSEQNIHKIRATMEALVNGAEKVFPTKLRQFQVRLNRARQASTFVLDADCQKAIERWDRKMHQVTLATRKLFHKLLQNHQ
jgi:hypothetical protein